MTVNQDNPSDRQHLKLLSIFHYIVAAMVGFFSLFPILYAIFGAIIIAAPEIFKDAQADPPPEFLGWLMIAFSGCFITIGLVEAGLMIAAGRFLSHHKHHTFCLVVACIECLFVPFGTILGVFTIVVLVRDSVKQLFDSGKE